MISEFELKRLKKLRDERAAKIIALEKEKAEHILWFNHYDIQITIAKYGFDDRINIAPSQKMDVEKVVCKQSEEKVGLVEHNVAKESVVMINEEPCIIARDASGKIIVQTEQLKNIETDSELDNHREEIKEKKVSIGYELKKAFFEKYNKETRSYRTMQKLVIINDISEELSSKSYAKWKEENRDPKTILLTRTEQMAQYYAFEAENNRKRIMLVGPSPDMIISDSDIVKYALDKFFEFDINLAVSDKELCVTEPAIFLVRPDGLFEFVESGVLDFK